jgi:hypothetical protein
MVGPFPLFLLFIAQGIFPLYYAQKRINAINAKLAPAADTNSRLTPANYTALLISLLFYLFATYLFFYPPSQEEMQQDLAVLEGKPNEPIEKVSESTEKPKN